MSRLPAKPKPDWAGFWFKHMEAEYGEYIGVRFGRRASGASEVEWTFLPHSSFDGIGGFAHYVRGLGLGSAAKALPMLREERPPSALAKAVATAKFMLRKPRTAARWRGLSPTWSMLEKSPVPECPSALAFECLSREQTARVTARAAAEGASLNSWLLLALASAVRSRLEPGPALWAVPVNMRGPGDGPADTGNFASYVQLEVRPEHGASDVHGLIRAGLKRREHWGAWLAINVGRIVGFDGVRKLLRRDREMGRCWSGTFSNIGAWQGLGEGEWYFCPPAMRSSLLCSGAVLCDGRLSLTLQMHPEVSRDPAWARGLVEEWVRGL